MDEEHPYQHLVSKEKLNAYIEKGYKQKKGIYSVEPEGPPDEIKQEVEDAKSSFGHVVAKEKERVKLIAEEENRRVMKLLRDSEEDVVCPICLEDIPAIFRPEDGPWAMNCCHVRLCRGCSEDWTAR